MTLFAAKVRTALALGVPNIVRVVGYRLGVKLAINPVRRLKAMAPHGPFFRPTCKGHTIAAPAVSGWQDSASLFSNWTFAISNGPPDWLANPINGKRFKEPDRHWWLIPDFDTDTGDIKLIWELSRMDWVLAFAQKVCKGEYATLERLNIWLSDWCARNPPYRGPNWKCGQEASIRVMHLAMATVILRQVRNAEPELLKLVRLHLQRIGPTFAYANAQDNNHATSEAAALFIGGSWLVASGQADGLVWADAGRRYLETLAARLIGPEGTFSQYSLNYHRVLLDTLCMIEIWRRHLGLEAFSVRWQTRAVAATQWMRHMVNAQNGDGPNIGANDGARLLQITETQYRDFRPSVQLASVLFTGRRAYARPGPWDDSMEWLNVNKPTAAFDEPKSYMADDGGFAIMRRGDALAVVRYPRFRFRPSQADALHLDFWVGANNLLRDAGTFSYNSDPHWLNYFGGTEGHNTVQFDERDQMYRLGRFLFLNWLKTNRIEKISDNAEATHFAAGYRDNCGAQHYRNIFLKNNHMQVTDSLNGFLGKAVLRWRLIPGSWQMDLTSKGTRLTLGPRNTVTLHISSSVPIVRSELVAGWESRHYSEKTQLPVLEVEIAEAGNLTTELSWST